MLAALLVTVGVMSVLATSAIGGVFASPALSLPAAGPASHGISPTAAVVVLANNTSAPNVSVTFKEIGLPNGSSWSVTAGIPAVTMTNTTVGHRGELKFSEPNGTLNYTISGPASFGVQKITGKGQPSLTSDLISGATVLTIRFSDFEQLSFQEIGLSVGSLWSVAIWSSFPHGGPSGFSGSDNVTSAGGWINFTVVRGPWKFNVTSLPTNITAYPSHGTVGVGAHNTSRDLRFRATHHHEIVVAAGPLGAVPRSLVARPAWPTATPSGPLNGGPAPFFGP